MKMYTSMKKISKNKVVEPTEFEQTVGQALFDLENTHQELKSDLKDSYINSASQVDVAGNKKAVVIAVPYRLTKQFCKIHTKLVRELEKKFSGKDKFGSKNASSCDVCRGKGFYMCKLCKGNATIAWSPLYDPVFINPCLCPTCDGHRIQRCLNCLGSGFVQQAKGTLYTIPSCSI